MHRIRRKLTERCVRVDVVGCGGTGSAIAAGLVYLHQSMLAFGHPAGLQVRLFDPDTVSPANCVRQAFARNEVGLNKAIVIANRINAFYGFDWEGVAERYSILTEGLYGHRDIVIGCVDTRAARRSIAAVCNKVGAHYWLDLGNTAEGGQFLLGEPRSNTVDRPSRLRTVAELWPELVDPSLDDDNLPSCSAAEALTRQAPFVNQVIANHALSLLSRLFRYGAIDFHGAFINTATGRVSCIPVPQRVELTNEEADEILGLAGSGLWDERMIMEAFDLDEYEIKAVPFAA